MHRQYVHVESRTLAYFDSAPGDRTARVVVFVHAFPLGAAMWEPQFKAAPAGWRFLAIDLRGFGGSTIPETDDAPPRLDDYADDVIDVLRELGITRAVFVGVSMGGYVTFAIVRKAATLVEALVLVDTRASADSLQGRSNRRSLLAVLDREGATGVAREMADKLIGATSAVERPDVGALIRRLIKQQAPAAIRGAIHRMMERPDAFGVVASLTMPTMIIVGDEDTLTPVEESRKMQQANPKAELVVFPRAGHLPSLEQPDAFNGALTAFLSRL